LKGRWWSAWLFLLLAGCSSVHRELHRPPAPLEAEAIVLYPLKVTGDGLPAFREYGLGERLVGATLGVVGARVAVFSPTEVTVLAWDNPAAWVGSDAVALLVHSGVRPEAALVLKASVEKRVTSQAQEAQDARGRRRGGWTMEETTWVGSVVLAHPSSGHLLAEVSGQAIVDPFAPPGPEADFDPAPALTRLLEQLVREALDTVGAYLARPSPPPPLRLGLAVSPARAAAIPDSAAGTLDPLAAELWRQNQARFLNPELPESEAAAVAAAAEGLWVTAAPDGASLRRGDLIVEVDGQPASRERLLRAPLRLTPVPGRVQRGAARLDVSIP
jgi:hypothetical protein